MHPACRTVLIVEDEPIIREFEALLLEDAGYRALEVGNADEALNALEYSDDVQIVVTDIHMPGSLDGLELAETIQARWPNTAIVIASSDIGRLGLEARHDLTLVAKPFTPDELISAVEAATA